MGDEEGKSSMIPPNINIKKHATLKPNQVAGARKSIKMLCENINLKFDHFRIDKGDQSR